MKVMWDNVLNGNYANENVSLGSGRLRLAKDAKNNERALIENFVKAADKGAAERANSQLNMNEMFHTLAITGEGEKQVATNEYFDWTTPASGHRRWSQERPVRSVSERPPPRCRE